MIPGEVLFGEGDISLNAGRPVVTLTVTNTGDRPIQVGSHYHFAETNPALAFDRAAAWGHRLGIPAGTSVRFEPGVPRRVTLVPLGGNRIVVGLRGECGGPLDAPKAKNAPESNHTVPEATDAPEADKDSSE